MPGAARADSVHALVDASCKVNDLGIFTAKLNGHIGLRGIILKGSSNGYDLLGEGHV